MNSHSFEAEAKKNLSNLPFPLPESVLKSCFSLQMAQIRVKFPLSESDFAGFCEIWEAKVVRWNEIAVIKAIRRACKGFIKEKSEELQQWGRISTDEVMQNVRDFLYSVEQTAVNAAKEYISEDSESWERLEIEEIARELEGKVVKKWEIALDRHFQWLENLSKELILPLNIDQSQLEHLSFHSFDRLLLEISEERKRKLRKELKIAFYGAIPRTFLQKYELELDFALRNVSGQMMKNVFSEQINRVMSDQMEQIAVGRLEVRLYLAF